MASGKWILATQYEQAFRMNSREYAFALRMRLNLPLQVSGIFQPLQRICKCGKKMTEYHAMVCHTKKQIIQRHNALLYVVKEAMEVQGYNTRVEQRVAQHGDKRIDIIGEKPSEAKDLAVDVTVRMPLQTWHKTFAAQRNLDKWQETAFTKKREYYGAHLKHTNFFIFLTSPTGGISKSSENAVKKIFTKTKHMPSGMNAKLYYTTAVNITVLKHTIRAAMDTVKYSRLSLHAPSDDYAPDNQQSAMSRVKAFSSQ
eukprot:m.349505 g.349505  ORF g.349505 m.349505 type:complete len:256 (-) comp16151_c1_seq4:967-1734(-)